MGKNSRRRATRRAKQKRIKEVRAVLIMGIDGPWHNKGYHDIVYGKYQADPPISTCLCKQCVIQIGAKKLGLWLK
jgi:hypothetical protein